MDREEYLQTIKTFHYGKRLPDALYIWAEEHPSWSPSFCSLVSKLRSRLEVGVTFNILKISGRDYAISFLRYPDFFTDPHPALAESMHVQLATGKARRISYERQSNPPILHRKESFLPPGHPDIRSFQDLTRQEEAAGLYFNSSTIGFRQNWQQLLSAQSLGYKGHQLIKLDSSSQDAALLEMELPVDRHRTAMSRSELSKPIRQAIEHGILSPELSVFDYGCGLGTDAEGLRGLGHTVTAWDPAYFPNQPKEKADFVNLGYVLNVIENPAERVETLVDAWNHTKQVLLVSTMIRGMDSYNSVRDFGDGVLTSRNTFQKYFDPDEIQGLIESALEAEAHPLAIGIYAVFRDPRAGQRFLAGRTRRFIDWDQLSSRLGFLRPRRKQGTVDRYLHHKDLLDAFWNCVLALGRLPQPGEFDREGELKEKIGGPKRVHRLFLEHYGPETYNEARRQRKEDLLVYLAMANFKKPVPLKNLDETLQSDIKSHFGSYRQAQEQGVNTLISTAQEEVLERGIAGLGYGWFDQQEGHFIVHRSLLEELPAVLRIYIECGAILYGDPREADLIKIHLWSKKLTFLYYDDFIGAPFPELKTRVKIDLGRRQISVFDHGIGPTHQLLFFKDRFLSSSHPAHSKAKTISLRLEKLGVSLQSLGSNDKNAPSRETFFKALENKGLTKQLTRKPQSA